MTKTWQILLKVSDDFIKKFPEYSQVVLQLLWNRELKEKEEIEEFLSMDYEKGTHDPFLFKDMKAVVELIIKHIKEQNKILVYGDFDADGVTASVLLVETLATLKAQVDVYIPDRVSEGCGLNKKAIKKIARSGVKLLITVDGGIRNQEEVAYAKKSGLEVIVTDHHIPPEDSSDLPDCLILNPMVRGEKYPFKYLSGVGVVAKLTMAIIRQSTLKQDDKYKLEEQLLDLTAIGTVADCVSLIGENRIFVKKGLAVINKTKRMGLQELIKIAGLDINNKFNSWNLGFQIAPRLNAAGRLGHANTAFELLITRDANEARSLAQRLNDMNIDRQKITNEIVDQVEELIKKMDQAEKIIFAVSPSVYGQGETWNEGVIGLVAGKISEKYYKPAIIITSNDQEIKGSGRSIEGFNMVEAIEETKSYLDKYGGHASACGFSLKNRENLEKFIKRMKAITIKKLKDIDLQPKLLIEIELNLDEIDEQFIAVVEDFSPFGQDNPRPKFVSYGATIVDIFHMGIDKQHIKLRIKDRQSSVISAIGFGQGEAWQHLEINDKIDIVYYIEMNEFNGRREVQLKIIDIKVNNNT